MEQSEELEPRIELGSSANPILLMLHQSLLDAKAYCALTAEFA